MKNKTRFGTLFFIIILIFTMLLLFSCRSAAPEPTSMPVTDTPSPFASLTPTQSETPHLTQTPSITMTQEPTDVKPLEQVLLTGYFATPSATFDVESVKTSTPATAESCVNDGYFLRFNNSILTDLILSYEEKLAYLQKFLGEYGTIEVVMESMGYKQGDLGKYHDAYFGDLTNDGVMDALIPISYGKGFGDKLYFVHCQNGEYEFTEILDAGTYAGYSIITIEDLNTDGILDIVLTMYPTMGSWNFYMYQIVSWDGKKLKNQVLQPGYYSMGSMVEYQNGWMRMDGLGGRYPYEGNKFEIIDIDSNGTKEVIITGGVLSTFNTIGYGPYQSITQTYMWNGEGYVLQDMVFGVPEYRYQAVVDGDIYTLLHKYEDAFHMYQMAIDDPDLAWWSNETRRYIQEKEDAIYGPVATPTLGVPDENEYTNLAAYAQFRLILLDVLQGDLDSAKQEFSAMQRNYPEGNEGYIFVEYAGVFLEEYQNSEDVTQACTAAYAFGMRYEAELLKYLDVNHGFQSMSYSLDSLCPFQ